MNEETEGQRSDQDKALASRWGKRLEHAIKSQREAKVEEKFKRLRKYVRGNVEDDGKPGLVRTNIIHSNFAAILPQVYAKNPEIAVSPSESADERNYGWVRPFCKTLQAVLNRVFINDGRLKKRAKAAIRAAMTVGAGWVKLSWQKDIRRDPIIENRIADAQDNLRRIRQLIADIEDGDESRCELEAKQGELEQQIAALSDQAEVMLASGVVLDNVLTEDIFVLDDALTDFDGYEQADAIAHRVWMTAERYKEVFGKEPPEKAARYGQDKRERGQSSNDADKVELVAVFEAWDRRSQTVYTLCAGADEWAREPYRPGVFGRRFYPFFALTFNLVDGSRDPLPDAELLIELQDEYNTTRTNFAEHRRENLPVRVFRKSGDLTDSDIRSLANRAANQWIGIEGDPSKPIQQDVAILQNPPVDPGTYDVQPILRDAEMVMGAGDAAKGTINKAKTATEAEIMAQGLQSRVGERQDVVEDWIGDMANMSAELCLQMMSRDEVVAIAGRNCVWPKLTKDEVFSLVSIQIRAGSTGKPNRNREREQWSQMLPQIQQAVQQIMQLRQAGQNDMAETVIKLLEETLHRFDERIDIEQFIPPRQEGGQQAQVSPEMQQQATQMQQALEAAQAQIEELTKAADANAANIALEREKLAFEQAKAAEQLSIEREKIAAELQAAQIREQVVANGRVEAERLRMEVEREKIASQERLAMIAEASKALTEMSRAANAAESAGQAGADRGLLLDAIESLRNAMQEVISNRGSDTGNMAQMMAEMVGGLRSHLTAPRRVIRDATGNVVGVEVVQ